MTHCVTARTPAALFADLPDQHFRSYSEFEKALVASFNACALDFPTGYGWRDALSWGVRNGVVRRDGDTIIILRDTTE